MQGVIIRMDGSQDNIPPLWELAETLKVIHDNADIVVSRDDDDDSLTILFPKDPDVEPDEELLGIKLTPEQRQTLKTLL